MTMKFCELVILAALIEVFPSAHASPTKAEAKATAAAEKAHSEGLEIVRREASLICSNKSYGRINDKPVLTSNARNHVRRVIKLVAKAGLDPDGKLETEAFMESLETDLATELARNPDCNRTATYMLRQRLISQPWPQNDS